MCAGVFSCAAQVGIVQYHKTNCVHSEVTILVSFTAFDVSGTGVWVSVCHAIFSVYVYLMHLQYIVIQVCHF